MRPLISHILLCTISATLIYLFSVMWANGSVVATEPNSWFRGIELAFFVGAFAYGAVCFVDWIMKEMRRR